MKVDFNNLSRKVMSDDILTKYTLSSAYSICKKINPYIKRDVPQEKIIGLIHPTLVKFINDAFDKDGVELELNKFLYETLLLFICEEYIIWFKEKTKNGLSTEFLFIDNRRGKVLLSLNTDTVTKLRLRVFEEFLNSFNDTKLEIIINTFLNTTDKSRNDINLSLKDFIIRKIEITIMFIVKDYSSNGINKQNIYDYCIDKIQKLKYSFHTDTNPSKTQTKKE